MTTETRTQTNYDKLIGRKGEEYYYLDYVFTHRQDFKGATGSIMRPVTEAEAEERRDDWDSDGEMWRQAVAGESTTLSQEEWQQQALAIDGDDLVFDLSYCCTHGEDLLERLGRDEYELVECLGGGRCFYTDIEWDELFEPELWELIKEYEGKPAQ